MMKGVALSRRALFVFKVLDDVDHPERVLRSVVLIYKSKCLHVRHTVHILFVQGITPYFLPVLLRIRVQHAAQKQAVLARQKSVRHAGVGSS